MKDMVSTARTTRKQPKWIGNTLWTKMTAYWDTEEAREKSATTSEARMSERGGLGPHVHLSGQKSYLQIQQEMEIELGRPVSLGEVFIRTHTRKDGTYVDRKAKSVIEAYLKNKDAKMSDLAEDSEISDGTSRRRALSIEEDDEIFLQSTFTNERGIPFGVGSLSQSNENGKRKYPGSASSYSSLQDQLQEAQRRIEEQAKENARREEEHAKLTAAQQAKIDQLTLVQRYLAETDPKYLDFIAANSVPTRAADPTSSAADPTTSGPTNEV